MKLLIDENLPHKLRHALNGHDCFTTNYMGWSGISNGELLRIAAANGFDAVISNDRSLEYQQNQATLPLSVVVLLTKDNKLKTIESMVPALIAALNDLKPRSYVKIASP
jgi:predicted nuclease of predicted toxin-antitoxin system